MKLSAKQEIRFNILVKYLNAEIHYKDAMDAMELKERQFRRVVARFKLEGIKALFHANKGSPPANKVRFSQRKKLCSLYKDRFLGLNLTHFLEKVNEETLLDKTPSYSTARRILMEEKLIAPKLKRARKSYPRRKRYEQEGLMVQIDGSPHHWIIGRSPICLTIAIDDATGKILSALFTPTETTFASMSVVRKIIESKGCFQMLYSDRAGIYGGGKRDGYSNMNRAMKQLGILPIQASTPQAKGRVERCFRTLQSRLVNELSLFGASTIEEANEFLENYYIDEFNKKFAKAALNPNSAYKKVDSDIELKEVFTMRSDRVVGVGNIVSYEGAQYLIHRESGEKQVVEVREYPDRATRMFIQNEEVGFEIFERKKAA